MPKAKKSSKKSEKTRPARVFYDEKINRYYIKVNKKRVYLDKKLATEEMAVNQSIKKYRVRRGRKPKTHASSYKNTRLETIEGFSKKYQDSNIKVNAVYKDPSILRDEALANKNKQETALYLEKAKQNELDADRKKRDELYNKEKKLQEENDKLLAMKIQIEEDAKNALIEKKTLEKEEKEAEKMPAVAGYPTDIEGIRFDRKGFRADQLDALRAKVRALNRMNNDELERYFTAIKGSKYDPTKSAAENIEFFINKHDKRDLVGRGADDSNKSNESNESNDKEAKIDERSAKFIRKNGLYSDQIAEILQDYAKDGFLGVVAADEVSELATASLNFDKFGFVMNKDTADKAGSHWVACFCDLNDASLEYYDSFAEEPDDLFLVEIKKVIDAHDLDYYLKFKINRITDQKSNSTLCGFHAMRFLIDRFKGKDWQMCSGYSEIKESEAAAGKMLKKYERFGYI